MSIETNINTGDRWFWLDWLRTISILAIFLYHSGMPFVIGSDWHIVNQQPDLIVSVVNLLLIPLMPLFFVISGIGTYFSLSNRSPTQLIQDRVRRLLIPFIFAGLILILPVHVYFDKLFHGEYTGDFLSFINGPYFTRFFPFDFNLSPTYLADSNQGLYL